MKCEEIIKRLRTLKIPAAYSHFNAPPSVPFVVYLIPETERYGSDSKNMLKRSTVRIELYTDHKDTALEDKLSALFSEFELDSYENYLSDQQLYQNTFEFEMIDKTGG